MQAVASQAAVAGVTAPVNQSRKVNEADYVAQNAPQPNVAFQPTGIPINREETYDEESDDEEEMADVNLTQDSTRGGPPKVPA